MNDFDAFERLLLEYGFERIYATQSVSHSSLTYQTRELPVDDYVLWHHPAGVVAHGHSSTWGGYTDSQGRPVPLSKALGSLTLEARVDCGTGPELQHRAAVHIGPGSSGGVDPQLDGTDVRTLSRTVHSNALGLEAFLERSQEHGRFLPVSRWPEKIGRPTLSLPLAFALPLRSAPAQTPEENKAFLEQQDVPALWERFAEQLPPAFSALVKRPEDEEDAAPGKKRRRGLRWDPVELGLKRFSEALFFAKKRWADSFDSDLLTHWSRAALGELGEDHRGWRAYERGPAGLSLPVAPLYAKPFEGQGAALLTVLKEAPQDVLRRWATEPDAAGYTLGLHAINRIFVERTLSHAVALTLIMDVLELLHERLGPEGLPMATATRSVLGLPLQFHPAMSDGQPTLEKTQREFTQVLTHLDAWGLDWSSVLRWRNYPNLFKKEEGKPHFFTEEGPEVAERWAMEMGERLTGEADGVIALLEARRMGEALPLSTAPNGARRARM